MPFSLLLLFVGWSFSIAASSSAAVAAEPELVGIAAAVVEAPYAARLGLTAEQTEKIWTLIDVREEEAVEAAMSASRATPEERQAILRPFRVESQRQLLTVLTNDQIEKLEAIRKELANPLHEPLLATSDPAPAPTAPSAVPTPQEGKSAEAPVESAAPENQSESDQPSTKPSSEPAAEPAPNGESKTGREGEPAPPTQPAPAASTEPSVVPPAAPVAAPAKRTDGKLQFNFRYQPWTDVLDWLATEADLSLVLEAPPTGTFNYTDSRAYSVSEAMDIINSVLLTKGYTLVRRERMLILVNLEDGIPPNLVADVSLAELDKRGEYELVRVLFPLRNMTPATAAEEVQRLIGPQGAVVVLPRAGMLQVTEAAGRVRAIRDVLQAIEQPDLASTSQLKPFELQNAMAAEVLPAVRQLMGIAADAWTTPEGSLQLALDTTGGNRFLARGTPEMLARLADVIALVDVAGAAGAAMADTLQLEVYPAAGADPTAVLQVLQTILADHQGVRLTTDPATGNLVALATPADHATVKATIQQMQADSRKIQAIPLALLDPQVAVLAINKLFGVDPAKPDPRAPVVDADYSTNTLLVRATGSQIEQIRDLLSQLGESDDFAGSGELAGTSRGNVRVLPITGNSARTAISQIEKIWPAVRPNAIRVVIPSRAIPVYRPTNEMAPENSLEDLDFGLPADLESLLAPPADAPRATAPADRETRVTRLRAHYVSDMQLSTPADAAAAAAPAAPVAVSNDLPAGVVNKKGAPVVITVGPGGTVIASEDLEALDALELLLNTTAGSSTSTARQYAVFYLKYAKAPAAAEMLNQIFGSGGGGGGGDMMSSLAGAALGDAGGGLVGDLLGLGGGSGGTAGFAVGAVDIVADARLNMLIVYAQEDDLEVVDQLLQVIDQNSGPEPVEAGGKARLIPVFNTTAASIAETVSAIYKDRLQSAGGQNQPSPEDIIRALRGGRGGAGGGGDTQEPEKMSIGVDTRSNSLVVRAPDPLFNEVLALVRELDEQQSDNTQKTEVVSIKYSNSTALRQALSSLLGENAKTSSSGSNQASAARPADPNAANAADQARRQAEFFQRIQQFREQMQRGGGPPGAGGGPGGGPGGGGRNGGGRGGRG